MVENPPASAGRGGKRRCDPWVGKSLWGRALATHSRIPGTSLVAQSVRNLQCGDLGSIPGSGKSPGERNGNPLQYSCPENSMDRRAWQTTVHGVAKGWAQLSN